MIGNVDINAWLVAQGWRSPIAGTRSPTLRTERGGEGGRAWHVGGHVRAALGVAAQMSFELWRAFATAVSVPAEDDEDAAQALRWRHRS